MLTTKENILFFQCVGEFYYVIVNDGHMWIKIILLKDFRMLRHISDPPTNWDSPLLSSSSKNVIWWDRLVQCLLNYRTDIANDMRMWDYNNVRTHLIIKFQETGLFFRFSCRAFIMFFQPYLFACNTKKMLVVSNRAEKHTYLVKCCRTEVIKCVWVNVCYLID